MSAATPRLTDRPSWKALAAHAAELRKTHLRELFGADPARGERLTAEGAGLFLDYSKHRATDETFRCCSRWHASAASPRGATPCSGREDQRHRKSRRAPRGAARPEGARSIVDGRTSSRACTQVLDRMGAFANRIRSGSGRAIRASGSATSSTSESGVGPGPVMAYEALKHYSDRAMRFEFVSNVDGTDFAECTRG
jgi:glucose-6-phosphate isomerase